MNREPVFKEYKQNQIRLLPVELNELIPPLHMVRVVHCALNSIGLKPLYDRYPGGGRTAYHLFMLLKVLVYAYADGIYSSRKIAMATREKCPFMWLTGS